MFENKVVKLCYSKSIGKCSTFRKYIWGPPKITEELPMVAKLLVVFEARRIALICFSVINSTT